MSFYLAVSAKYDLKISLDGSCSVEFEWKMIGSEAKLTGRERFKTTVFPTGTSQIRLRSPQNRANFHVLLTVGLLQIAASRLNICSISVGDFCRRRR